MTSTTISSNFHIFSKLPPEIRTMIWRHALPETDDPALFSYKKGCWHDPDLPGLHPHQQYPYPGYEVQYKFCHKMLDPVPVKLPLALVSYEAREVALAWARQQEFEELFSKVGEFEGFVRRFDPIIDTLFVGHRHLDMLLSDSLCPESAQHSSGGCAVHSRIEEIGKIAMPEKIFRDGIPSGGDLSDFVECVLPSAQLFIIKNPQPRFKRKDSMKVQRRWEIAESHDTRFHWHPTCGHFHSDRESDIIDNLNTPEQMKIICDGLADIFFTIDHEEAQPDFEFEVQSALAIRK